MLSTGGRTGGANSTAHHNEEVQGAEGEEVPDADGGVTRQSSRGVS